MISPSTQSVLNIAKAVCHLLVVAVLCCGCTAGRVNLELQDVSVNPGMSTPVPIIPKVP